MATVTTEDAILKALDGRKRGITAKDLAHKTGKNLGTIRRTMQDLSSGGVVKVVGALNDGTTGRPPNLYLMA